MIDELRHFHAPTAAPTLGEQLLIVVLLAASFGFTSTTDTWISIDAEATEKVARVERVLLEPSMWPADLDECQRAEPQLPRPDGVVSFQNGSGTPWHHRQCYWANLPEQEQR